MLKFEHTEVYGISHAMRGMRNALDSHHLADTQNEVIGTKDLKLAQKLSRGGSSHAKYLRMMTVWVDLTAPFYWWKEFSTYKVGTTANSYSTMHKIHAREITLEDFSIDHLSKKGLHSLKLTLIEINDYRQAFLKTGNKDYWYHMIALLPNSFNQKRTLCLNYQVIKEMYWQRKHHKLYEWRNDFCKWAESLPYFKELCIDPMFEGKEEDA